MTDYDPEEEVRPIGCLLLLLYLAPMAGLVLLIVSGLVAAIRYTLS